MHRWGWQNSSKACADGKSDGARSPVQNHYPPCPTTTKSASAGVVVLFVSLHKRVGGIPLLTHPGGSLSILEKPTCHSAAGGYPSTNPPPRFTKSGSLPQYPQNPLKINLSSFGTGIFVVSNRPPVDPGGESHAPRGGGKGLSNALVGGTTGIVRSFLCPVSDHNQGGTVAQRSVLPASNPSECFRGSCKAQPGHKTSDTATAGGAGVVGAIVGDRAAVAEGMPTRSHHGISTRVL